MVEAESLLQRHPNFYYEDGLVVFAIRGSMEVPGTLYRLHPHPLSLRSKFFESLFSLPVNTVTTEGKSDEAPIILPSDVDPADLNHLLMYLYWGPRHPKSQAFLISVLKLSTIWEIEDGREHAINTLEGLGFEFHPALQFYLARLYRVDHWIEPAFRRLMDRDTLSLELDHIFQIGQIGVYWLMRTKAKVQSFKARLAFDVLPVRNDFECAMPASCGFAWKKEWWDGFAQLIHHPVDMFSSEDLQRELENVKIPGMCDACQACTVADVIERGIFLKEEGYLREAIDELMKWQTEDAIRKSLPTVPA